MHSEKILRSNNNFTLTPVSTQTGWKMVGCVKLREGLLWLMISNYCPLWQGREMTSPFLASWLLGVGERYVRTLTCSDLQEFGGGVMQNQVTRLSDKLRLEKSVPCQLKINTAHHF